MKNKKIKTLILVVSILFLVTGCPLPTHITNYEPIDFVNYYDSKTGANQLVWFDFDMVIAEEDYDLYFGKSDLWCDGIYVEIEDLGNGAGKAKSITDFKNWPIRNILEKYGKENRLSLYCEKKFKTTNPPSPHEITINFVDKKNNIVETFKTIPAKVAKGTPEGNLSTQAVPNSNVKDIVNIIGGSDEYCNVDSIGNYRTLDNTNIFSKIAFSQVECNKIKYSNDYDNGISFINWVLEKAGKTARLPKKYSELIEWAGTNLFTSNGTNISAGDLVIFGDDENAQIKIIVNIEDQIVTTAGYDNVSDTAKVYEEKHLNFLNGNKIIKMKGISY